MQHTNLTLTVLVAIGTLCSCSRSLTDIGYTGGPRTTIDMSSVGFPDFSEHAVNASMKTLSYHYPSSPYPTGNRCYYYVQPLSKGDSVIKEDSKGLYFLQEFYTALNNEFNPKKFGKKYGASVNASIKDKISSSVQLDSVDNHYGWQIFNDKKSAPVCKHYQISYEGNSWYSITSDSASNKMMVLVELQPASKGKGFLITGLKNESRGIDIEE